MSYVCGTPRTSRASGLYIEKVAAPMRPGGIFAITTRRCRQRRWRDGGRTNGGRFILRAIYIISRKHTLRLLLENRGFEVCYMGYAGCYRSMDTIAYILPSLNRGTPGLYGKLKATRLLNWSFYSNFYDIVYVIAGKARVRLHRAFDLSVGHDLPWIPATQDRRSQHRSS